MSAFGAGREERRSIAAEQSEARMQDVNASTRREVTLAEIKKARRNG